ncbi:MAG TPA: protein kinase [Vicinamibacterales bacterium]|nr:protein kinase [Vicinamibacterales bacterium]
MALTPGARLGPYEITAQIGAGGMGEVWSATDTNLGRQVAIKVLPETLASDGERLTRFEREAKTLASLNHPNIAIIHGLEKTDGVRGLVMELVEGPTLAERIAQGPIPVDDALPIARQIAEALEAAHEQGVIHRDLKPANVKVRDDGMVKVLDFGLAKLVEPVGTSAAAGVATLSPTITTPAITRIGVILGTAAYMSPEQAKGKPADKRSDIWAFGCVLYEMLTGTRTFDGEEITDVLAAVVRAEPNWSRLPANTPAAFRRLLRRSLVKDRKHRLADIADARLELDEIATNPAADNIVPLVMPFFRRPWFWIAIALVSVMTAATAVARMILAPSTDARIVRFDIASPPGTRIEAAAPLSPDGRLLAFVAPTAQGVPAIWVRPLDSPGAHALPGSEGATRFFWSPDSQQIGFFRDGNLFKIAVGGGQTQLLANGPFRDGAWSGQGLILVGGQQGRGLLRLPEVGGQPIAETGLDASRGEISHDYPVFLPDGRHYIYLARSTGTPDAWATYVGTLDSKERRPLPGIPSSAVAYSPTGHLLFIRAGTLMVQRFNLERLELSGDAVPVADGARGRSNTFSVSANGTLAFLRGAPLESQLVWFDRTGRRLETVGSTAVYRNSAFSRDGRFAVFERGAPSDLWILDFDKQFPERMSIDRPGNRSPLWSPDGRTIVFVSSRNGVEGLYERRVGGVSGDSLLRQSGVPMALSDWSRDGRYLAYAAGGDIWALPMFGTREPVQVTASPFFQDVDARFSPDGRSIAYGSDESSGITRRGEGDVFVQSFPQRDFKRQVSTAGGFVPRWSADGTELFYVAPNGTLMVASITARGSTLVTGTPKPLFRPGLGQADLARYDVFAGNRLMVNVRPDANSMTVIVNWFEELKRLTPTK